MIMLIAIVLSLILLTLLKIAGVTLALAWRIVRVAGSWSLLVACVIGSGLVLFNLGDVRAYLNPPSEIELLLEKDYSGGADKLTPSEIEAIDKKYGLSTGDDNG